MTRDGENTCEALLTPLGFVAEGRQTWTLWRLGAEALATAQKRAKSRALASPWRLAALELAERRGTLSLAKLVVTLDEAAFLANLQALARKYFGGRTSGRFVPGSSGAGDVWCVFEFPRPGTREKAKGHAQQAGGALLPLGTGGFDVRFLADGAQGQVLVSDVFGFGYLPSALGSAPLRFVAEALGLKAAAAAVGLELKPESVNELRFPLHLPALLHLLQNGAAEPALVELHEVLSRMRTQPSPVVLRSESGLLVVSPGEDAEQVAPGLREVTFVPLEVLESRERAARYRDIDQLILAGKPSRALKVAEERLAADPGGLYLMRRLALLGLGGRKDAAGGRFLERALALEPDHKLFLSLAVENALTSGRQTAVLEALSRLGSLLMSQIPGADQLAPFDVALPELLGDAWAAEDPLKAEECYHRVLERRGDLPRILRKLVELARRRGRAEQEVGYLHRLAAVERRRSELARLTLRLAELRRAHATGLDEAVQLALKALKLDRAFVPAARLAGELLVTQGRPEEAINLLDGLLKDARLPLPALARAGLEADVGMIWLTRLGRPDLAETRFEAALALNPADAVALRELETMARARLDHRMLARILELRFAVHEAAGDGAAMKRLFDELVPLYRGALGVPQRAYDLYQRLLAGDATPEDVDLLLGWDDVTIDWAVLYAKLALTLPRLPAGQARGQFLCRLAEVVRAKLGDATLALRHLRGALDEGWIDAAGFELLTQTLAREKDYASLANAYERRIGQVQPAEQRRLLAELLRVPEVLTEARRDALAVQAYQLSATEEKLVQQRFHVHQGLEDLTGVARVTSLLQALPGLTGSQQRRWLRFAVDILGGMQAVGRFALIDDYFRRLLELDEDRISVLQDAVQALAPATHEGKRLVHYVSELLAAGVLPPLEERRIETLLGGHDHELALYHQLQSFKVQTPEVAASHARIAAALYAKRANQEANTEKMIARLCTLVPCSESDLAQLRSLVVRSGNWVLLAKALQRQADFEDERQRKYTLLEQLGVLYWKKLKDTGRARLTFVLAMKHAPHPVKLKLVLATIAAEVGDAGQERKALVDFLVDPAAAQDLKAMTRAVERLLGLGEDGAALTKLMQARIDAAVQAGEWERVVELGLVLLDNQVASTDLCRTVFKAALFTGQDARVVDAWWRGLACVSNKTKAKAYMIETAAILDKEGRRDLQLAAYGAALENGIGERLGPKIEHELRLQYGALLFDTDNRRRKALAVYREAHAAEPDDHRTWMPLYFLLLEFGTPNERLAHLAEVLPKLAQDPRPLKPFPLTVESLQVEMAELREQTHLATWDQREPASAGPSQGSPRAGEWGPHAAGVSGQVPTAAGVIGDFDDDRGAAPRLTAQALPRPELGDFGDADDDELPVAAGLAVDAGHAAVAGEAPGFGLPPPPPADGPVARAFTVVGRPPTDAAPSPGVASSNKPSANASRPRALPPLPSLAGAKEAPTQPRGTPLAAPHAEDAAPPPADASGDGQQGFSLQPDAESPAPASPAGANLFPPSSTAAPADLFAASSLPPSGAALSPAPSDDAPVAGRGLPPGAGFDAGFVPPGMTVLPDGLTFPDDAAPADAAPLLAFEVPPPLPQHPADQLAAGDLPAAAPELSLSGAPAPAVADMSAAAVDLDLSAPGAPASDAGAQLDLPAAGAPATGAAADLFAADAPATGAAVDLFAPAAGAELDLSSPVAPATGAELNLFAAPTSPAAAEPASPLAPPPTSLPGLAAPAAPPATAAPSLSLDPPSSPSLPGFDLAMPPPPPPPPPPPARDPESGIGIIAVEPSSPSLVDLDLGAEAPPSATLFDPALPLGALPSEDSPDSSPGLPGLPSLAVDAPSSPSDDGSMPLGTPGAFALDKTGAKPRALPAAAADSSIDLGAGVPSVSPAEVSSIELAAAIDGPAASEPPEDPSSSQEPDPSGTGLPLPRHDASSADEPVSRLDVAAAEGGAVPPAPGSSRAEGAWGGSPPRFGTMGSSQIAAQSSLLGAPDSSHLGTAASRADAGEPAFGLHVEAADDVADWRAAVLKGDFNADLTGRLLKQAFASEIEKHLAIQCVALVAGNCDRLVNWHWRVWRNAGEYGYALTGKERFPSEFSPPILHSTLHKLVLTSAPALVRVFRPRYTLEHIAKKLEMKPEGLEKLRRPLSWTEGVLRDAGFHLYAQRIESRRYQVFNLPGLGREIFYEGATRCLYLDEAHYRKTPPSHLFHRMLSVLWSVRIHYFVPLALHPIKDFYPFLGELGQMFGSAGISRLATKLGAKKGGTVAKRLEGLDLRQIRALHEKMGRASEEQVAQLWDAMRAHLFRLLLAETLDVIGVFEAILDRDLLQKNALKHSEIYQLSPFAKLLIEFVTRLRI